MVTPHVLPSGDELRVFADAGALARGAAEDFVERARRAVGASGRFDVALSGGSTPLAMFRELAEEEPGRGLVWRRIHVFWSDERTVGPEDPESNYGAAWRTLLSRVAIPRANLHRPRGEDADAVRAAARYESEIRAHFEVGAAEVPAFDLVDLGLGADGHTASLFPETPALDETRRLVAANPVAKLGAVRLTFTYPLLDRARCVRFVVSGERKAGIVQAVLEGPRQPRALPAQGVRPAPGALRWWLDAAAASRLTVR